MIERRQAVLTRILEIRDRGLPVTPAVRYASRSLGVGERTIWRWLSDGEYQPGSRSGWTLTDEAIEALYLVGGRPVVAWRSLRDREIAVPSRSVFCAAVNREISRAELAYMRSGEDGRRRYSIYRRWEPEARNEIWEADHAQLDVYVLVPRSSRPVRPWLTLIVDGFSRVVMGWTLSLRPTTDHVLAAMHQAIIIDPERGPWGGVPDLIRFDGGKEFLAQAITRATGELGCAALPTLPYSPQLKGKVERMHQTISQGLIAGLPHYTGGPRKANGSLYVQGRHLHIQELQNLLTEFIHAYNHEHAHSSLGHMTPAEKWMSSARPLDTIDEARLRWMLLADETRKVQKDGIHFKGAMFVAPALARFVGRNVEVRYMPHDQRQIEVFTSDGWICTAHAQNRLTRAQSEAIIQERQQLNREMGRRAAKARRKAIRRLAPIVPGGAIEDITVVTDRGPREPTAADEKVDATLRLLGQGHRLNAAIPAHATDADR